MDYKKIISSINMDFFNKESKKYKEENKDNILNDVLNKKDKLFSMLEKTGPIHKVMDEVKLLFSLVQDYATGKYRDVSWTTIAGVVGTLIYVVSPLDLIPDFIIGIGLLDDLALIAFCLEKLKGELNKYQSWKNIDSTNNLLLDSEEDVFDITCTEINEDLNNYNNVNKKKGELTMKEKIYDLVSQMKANDVEMSDRLKSELEALENEAYKVSIVGEFKVGKSTLINKVFLDEDLLFTDVGEATSVPTEIVYGDNKKLSVTPTKYKTISKTFDGGEKIEERVVDGIGEVKVTDNPTTEDIKSATTANSPEERAQLAKDIVNVELQYPNDAFKKYKIYDTPGINTPNEAVSATTYRIIPQSDIAVVVVEYQQLSTVVTDFLRKDIFANNISQIMLLVNYTTKTPASKDSRANVIANINAQLANIGREYVPVQLISLDFNKKLEDDVLNNKDDIANYINSFLEKNVLKGRIEKIESMIGDEIKQKILSLKIEAAMADKSEQERQKTAEELKEKVKEFKKEMEHSYDEFVFDMTTLEKNLHGQYTKDTNGIRDKYLANIKKSESIGEIKEHLQAIEDNLPNELIEFQGKYAEETNKRIKEMLNKYNQKAIGFLQPINAFIENEVKIDGGILTSIPTPALLIVDLILTDFLLPGGFILDAFLRFAGSFIPFLRRITPMAFAKRWIEGNVSTSFSNEFKNLQIDASHKLRQALSEIKDILKKQWDDSVAQQEQMLQIPMTENEAVNYDEILKNLQNIK